jgi:cellobiose epimerase
MKSLSLKVIISGMLIILFDSLSLSAQTRQSVSKSDSMITVFEQSLRKGVLDVWYPRMIDSVNGGYFSNATFDWKIPEHQPKMLVTQSRLIWTSSEAALFYNDSTYTKYARHGFQFLTKHMWDSTHGGFFNIRSKTGTYTDEMYGNTKTAYGNAFAIYGLTSYYKLTKDTVALNYARKTFLWLDKHSHDNVHGGYVDAMSEDGIWLSKIKTDSREPGAGNGSLKDYNSTIHLMEAFTELYKVWPDPLVKSRLQEVLTIVRDTFVNKKGYLNLYFTDDWKLVSNRDSSQEVIRSRSWMDHITFGHDVETAFLLLEASYALGEKNETTTLKIAKKLVDHALANGFNQTSGGFYDEGYYLPGSKSITILSKNAQWWVQAEGLNALLLMSKIFPGEKKYYQSYLKMWSYIDNYLIDKQHGDWYINGLNYNPEVIDAPKASVWKCNYHNGRALMNCIRMLKNENEVVDHFSKTKL